MRLLRQFRVTPIRWSFAESRRAETADNKKAQFRETQILGALD
jgi:hypothetical protein